MHNLESVLENETHKLRLDFEIQTDHQILARQPDLKIINEKRELAELWTLLPWCTTEWNWKWIEGYSYLDLPTELKSLWNMKVTKIPIAIGALGTVTKGLVQGLDDLEMSGREETIQTTELLRSARILRRVLETWRNLFSFKL